MFKYGLFGKGYDKEGYNKFGYDRSGFDKYGFDIDGYYRDGYDKEGFNKLGYNVQGYDRAGFNADGYNRAGFDKYGFDIDGYNCDGYDKEGFNKLGYDMQGYDRSGYNSDGYSRDGFDRYGYDKNGFDHDGYNRLGYHAREYAVKKIFNTNESNSQKEHYNFVDLENEDEYIEDLRGVNLNYAKKRSIERNVLDDYFEDDDLIDDWENSGYSDLYLKMYSNYELKRKYDIDDLTEDSRIIYITKERLDRKTGLLYKNVYRLKENVVIKCNHLIDDEEKITVLESWDINDPDMPKWLLDYI